MPPVAMDAIRRRLRRRVPSSISRAQNDLGLRMLGRLASQRPDVNVCVSPTGLALSLAAAHLGASGETRDDIGRALGLTRTLSSDPEVHLKSWRQSFAPPGEQDPLTLAASLWLPPGAALSATYLESLRSSLDAQADVLLGDESADVDRINEWARRSTRGRITHVLRSLDPSSLVTVLTVVDMHARWKTSFDPKYSRDGVFQLGPGRITRVPMMTQSGSIPHFRIGEVEGAALAYAGGRRRMVFLLPSSDRSLDDIVARLDLSAWRRLIGRLRPETGTIALPRFQFAGVLSLDRVLAELGLGRIFDPERAELAGLGRGASAVGSLVQVVRLEVDEEGTQASAVTLLVQVVAVGLPRPSFFEMRLDRPFLFAIEAEPGGDLIFLGVVRDPGPSGIPRA